MYPVTLNVLGGRLPPPVRPEFRIREPTPSQGSIKNENRRKLKSKENALVVLSSERAEERKLFQQYCMGGRLPPPVGPVYIVREPTPVSPKIKSPMCCMSSGRLPLPVRPEDGKREPTPGILLKQVELRPIVFQMKNWCWSRGDYCQVSKTYPGDVQWKVATTRWASEMYQEAHSCQLRYLIVNTLWCKWKVATTSRVSVM